MRDSEDTIEKKLLFSLKLRSINFRSRKLIEGKLLCHVFLRHVIIHARCL